MSLSEFKTEAELKANYLNVRRRFQSLRPPQPKASVLRPYGLTADPWPAPPKLKPKPVQKSPRPIFLVAREEDGPVLPAMSTIKKVVASHYGVTVLDVESERRTANVVRPRQIAQYLAKTMTLRSLPEIGRRFGGRDHTTVLHAVRKITEQRQHDTELDALLCELEAKVRSATEKMQSEIREMLADAEQSQPA